MGGFMYDSRKGFTLAEVLVTLAIIGVVAALTIPALIQNTNKQRYQTALKKTISVLNSAIKANIAEDDIDAGDSNIDSTSITPFFSSRLNVLSQDGNSLWLTDGTRLSFFHMGGGNGCKTLTPTAFIPNGVQVCFVIVDVNGDKKPNTAATTATPSDVYILGISPTSVLPVILSADTVVLPGLIDINGNDLDPPYTNILNGNNASYSVMTGAT